MIKTNVFIQARISSTRLKNKVLLKINEKHMLSWVLKRAKQIKNIDKFVLLCDYESHPFLKEIAFENDFEILAGPKDNVLKRFAMGIKEFDCQYFFRITADNPLFFFELASELIRESENNYDYISYKNLAYGAGFELVKKEALLKADEEANDEYDKEHVCPFLYKKENESLFNILFLEPEDKEYISDDLKITVDTKQDFENICKIYSKLANEENKGIIPSKEVINFLR